VNVGDEWKCRLCDGRGWIIGFSGLIERCPICHGRGKVDRWIGYSLP